MLLIKSTNATSIALLHSKQNVTHHPRRFWKTITVLPDELRISQSLADYAAHDFNKPVRQVYYYLLDLLRFGIKLDKGSQEANYSANQRGET
jgi:hypothetical protein